MNRKEISRSTEKTEKKIVYVPVVGLRMMTDEEWNRLAYRNYLDRRATI